MRALIPAIIPIASCRRCQTRAVPGAPWSGYGLSIMTRRANMCSSWRMSFLDLEPRASVGPNGCGSNGKPGPMGSRGSYSRQLLCGTSAACGARPKSMHKPMRISKSAVVGCASSPTDASMCPSAAGSPRPPAKLFLPSASNAQGCHGRSRADKSSWISV